MQTYYPLLALTGESEIGLNHPFVEGDVTDILPAITPYMTPNKLALKPNLGHCEYPVTSKASGKVHLKRKTINGLLSLVSKTQTLQKFSFVSVSKPFADFVDNEINGNISDFDLSDEDDDDADPNFLPEAVQADQNSSDEEDVETAELTLEQTRQQPGTSRPSLGTKRIFWKKDTSFHPLSPAPELEEPDTVPLNLPPNEYVSKYLPDDILNSGAAHF
ncbi:hypothetical protein J6590_084676 [Homalodisca vitripennis]|nr:hypothetical protein J6590_084676 [Homalodisca vitripennis]